LKVRANNAIGSSGWCLLNSVPTKPNAVSVTLGAVTTNSAAVSWSSAAGADSYDVYRTRNGTQTLVYSGSGLSYTNTGLTACTSGYVYTVYASGPWGYTSVSNSVTANTACSGTS
jgi:chitin-binding protein